MTRFYLVSVAVVLLFFAACSFGVAKPYLDVQEITTEKGLRVWFVRDTTTPVVALEFSVGGGAALDPAGKEGVATLLTTLLDEGAGSRDAEAFQDALDSHGVQIGFNAGRDRFYGSMKTTLAYKDVADGLFDDALNKPHLADDAVARMKDALLSSLRFKKMNPQWIAGRHLAETVFQGQDYARPVEGDDTSLAALTRADVATARTQLFCKDQLLISVVGDVTAQDVAAMADRFFGAWPSCAHEKTPEPQKMTNAGKTVTVPWGGAQHVVMMAQPGVQRKDKDWWAARLLDFSLGGGQFSSRLMDEVRVKHGLTYGVSSGIVTYDRGPLWMVQSSIDPKKTGQAIAMIKTIWRDVAENGLTAQEIDAAKSYMIGVMPLALTSTSQIASILLQLQEEGLPKDTLDRRAAEIAAVTQEDVKRVARERLLPDALSVVIVGPEMAQ